MTGHLAYKREPGDFAPPLGGKPWVSGVGEQLEGFRAEVTRAYALAERESFSVYGARQSNAVDVYHMGQVILGAWSSATFSDTDTAYGMFEVRLLSYVLVARHNIVPAMQRPSEGVKDQRPAISYVNDLRTAARVLAMYTGADAEEIEERSHTQSDLLAYLDGYRSTLKGRAL